MTSASPIRRLVGKPTMSEQIPSSNEPPGTGRADRVFATTHWSVVLAARDDGPEGLQALEVLCRAYWTPLYAYALRDGLTPPDAQDAVQGLLAQLLARRDLHRVGPERGRFRSFLMAALKHFLVSRRRGENAAKRGGGAEAASLDAELPEGWSPPELAAGESPDRAFDREWARRVMARALDRLETEHASPRRRRLFEAVSPALTGEGRLKDAAETAAALGTTPGALAVAATRLRQRYRELIEEEVRSTLSDPADLEEEMRALRSAWD